MSLSRGFVTLILLGLVSLFADIAYEGSRSVLGSYIRLFEASAVIASVLAIGDFVGYLLRLVSGVIIGFTASSRVLWSFIVSGYLVNLCTVPLLAFARSWQDVVMIIVAERCGKGIRTPARDVVLAEVSEGIGRGRGFGIHELMDQIGAVVGPIAMAMAIASKGYRYAFIILAIPAAIAVVLTVLGAYLYPRVRSFETRRRIEMSIHRLGLRFLLYIAFVTMLCIGFLHWGIVSYYLKDVNAVSDYIIPLLYTVAMAIDAAVAIPIGWLYDVYGLRVLVLAPIIASAIPILLAFRTSIAILIASCCWGFVMGICETVMRAAVADLVEPTQRGYAYGVYNFVFGASWMCGSILAGLIYDRSLHVISIAMPILCLAALIPLTLIASQHLESVQPLQSFSASR